MLMVDLHKMGYMYFFAQYMSEVEQVVSNVSIALRKGKGSCTSQKVSDDMLNSEKSLKRL